MAETKFFPEKHYAKLTPGRSLRIARELQGVTQAELAEMTGISQPAVSALERDEEQMGIDRAKKLARALRVHPAVLAFPDWDVVRETRRAPPEKRQQVRSRRTLHASKARPSRGRSVAGARSGAR